MLDVGFLHLVVTQTARYMTEKVKQVIASWLEKCENEYGVGDHEEQRLLQEIYAKLVKKDEDGGGTGRAGSKRSSLPANLDGLTPGPGPQQRFRAGAGAAPSSVTGSAAPSSAVPRTAGGGRRKRASAPTPASARSGLYDSNAARKRRLPAGSDDLFGLVEEGSGKPKRQRTEQEIADDSFLEQLADSVDPNLNPPKRRSGGATPAPATPRGGGAAADPALTTPLPPEDDDDDDLFADE